MSELELAHQYTIGNLTYEKVFKAAGLTNLSDMQAVLDAVEVALSQQAEPAPAQDEQYPPCDFCGVIPDHHPWHGSGLFNGVDSPHIHACNGCRHLLPVNPAQTEQQPVAVVDAGDDGMWADILPDVTVKVGQMLYAAPIAQTEQQPVTGEQLAWWKEHLSVHLAILFRANGKSMAEAERSAAQVIRDAERIAPIAQTAQGDDQ